MSHFLDLAFRINRDTDQKQSLTHWTLLWDILKNDFSSRADSSIFKSTASELFDQSNQTSWVNPRLKSTDHFLLQSLIMFKFRSQLSCCHESDTWSHLEQRVGSSALIVISWVTHQENNLFRYGAAKTVPMLSV